MKGVFALPSGSASEPSANLAPRLDRRGASLPWVRRHFIISAPGDKGRVVRGEPAAACSKVANAGLRHRIRRAAIAAVPVSKQRGVGGGRRPAGAIGPVLQGGNGGEPNINAIGSDDDNGRPRRRQLARRPDARASAQLVRVKISSSACVHGPAVM